VDILTKEQKRALGFVDACNRSGYQPTHNELLLWLSSPTPRTPQPQFTRNLARMAIQFAAGFNMEGGEDSVEHLVRIGWLRGVRLQVTALGIALLRSSERTDVEDDGVDVVALGREDPLSYPRLMAHVAEMDDAILVDPYLRVDELHHIVELTTVSRILLSKQHKGSKDVRAAIAVYLGSRDLARPVDVRASADDDVHDRFIANAQVVKMIGHSLNGIAARTASSLVVPLPQAAADGMRQKIEAWWEAAEAITPSQPPVLLDSKTSTVESPSAGSN